METYLFICLQAVFKLSSSKDITGKFLKNILFTYQLSTALNDKYESELFHFSGDYPVWSVCDHSQNITNLARYVFIENL